MKRRNLAKGNLKEIPKKVREQRYATPLNGSAVGRKGLRVYDGGWIRIENGGLQVTGTAIISGVLDVTGTTNLSGTTNISGPLNVTGATTISGSLDVTGPTNLDGLLTINGDTTITGLLDITGDTTVAGNFEIVAGGLFQSGTVEIRPDGSADFGDLHVDTTGKLTSGQFELNPDGSAKFGLTTVDIEGRITSGNIQIDPTGSGLIRVGDTQIQELPGSGMMLYANGTIQLAGHVDALASFTLLNAPTAPGGSVANVWMDANGQLHRI